MSSLELGQVTDRQKYRVLERGCHPGGRGGEDIALRRRVTVVAVVLMSRTMMMVVIKLMTDGVCGDDL